MKSHEKAYGVVPYKIKGNNIKILLCKSVASKDKWGCLKGTKNKNETDFECARREFFEESSIKVNIEDFEEYFEQINIDKDIGVWLVNANKIENFDKYFNDDTLKSSNLSWENSKVKLFSLTALPRIKTKQVVLLKDITDFLRNKNLSH